MKWLHKRGEIWHYRFSLNGKEYTGTTNCTDLETATVIMQEVRKKIILDSPRTTRRKGESNPNVLRQMKLKLQDCRCEVCGWGASRDTLNQLFNKRITPLEMHHILPVRHGGKDSESNLIALCPQCHWIADRCHHIRGRFALIEKIRELQQNFTYIEPTSIVQPYHRTWEAGWVTLK